MKELKQITVNVLVDNTADMLSSRPPHITPELRILTDAGMKEMAGESLCLAQHGLCLAVTAHRGDEARTVLFDAGPDPTPWSETADTPDSISAALRPSCSPTATLTTRKDSQKPESSSAPGTEVKACRSTCIRGRSSNAEIDLATEACSRCRRFPLRRRSGARGSDLSNRRGRKRSAAVRFI